MTYLQIFKELTDEKIPYLDKVLNSYGSRRRRSQAENYIVKFADWLEKNRKVHILLADAGDIIDFFDIEINSRNIKKVSKEVWRTFLLKYYTLVEELLSKSKRAEQQDAKTIIDQMNIDFDNVKGSDIKNLVITLVIQISNQFKKIWEFRNPVPSRNLYTFSDTAVNEKHKSLEEHRYMRFETIKQILDYFFMFDYQIFYILLIVAYTGMRISEAVSIQTADFHPEKRFLVSGKIMDHKKSGTVLYILPDWIEKFHEHYRKKYLITDFLFPERQRKGLFPFLSRHTIYNALAVAKMTLNIKERCSPHQFRHAINNARKRLTKTLDEDRALLLNQKSSMNAMNYLDEELSELIQIYDENMPFPEYEPPIRF